MLLWAAIAIAILFATLSLAVDWGRVQLVKTELQGAADAAALAASAYASGDLATGRATAQQIAAGSNANGSPVSLNASDIEYGNWDSATSVFTSGGSPTNAVRVTASCTTARGNPVPLMFASLIGYPTMDVRASSIAYHASDYPYGIIGLTAFVYKGSGVIDSFNSANGVYSGASAGSSALCASNSNMSLTGSGTLYGDARPGVGCSTSGSTTITGSTLPLTSPIVAPAPSAGSAVTTNDNANISAYLNSSNDFEIAGQTVTIPPGTYYVNKFMIRQAAEITISGPVTFYVAGTLTVQDSAKTMGNRPINFKIINVGTSDSLIKGSNEFEAVVYSPNSKSWIQQSRKFSGSIVGKDLTIDNSAQVHYDVSLGGPTAGAGLSLVR